MWSVCGVAELSKRDGLTPYYRFSVFDWCESKSISWRRQVSPRAN